jgi:hypothetical protein
MTDTVENSTASLSSERLESVSRPRESFLRWGSPRRIRVAPKQGQNIFSDVDAMQRFDHDLIHFVGDCVIPVSSQAVDADPHQEERSDFLGRTEKFVDVALAISDADRHIAHRVRPGRHGYYRLRRLGETANAAAVSLEPQSVTLDLSVSDRMFPAGPGSHAVNNNCLAYHSANMVLNQPVLP